MKPPKLELIAKICDASAMTYAGGKNKEGVYQSIINLMPPHDVYIELFLGSGGILRRKKPADVNIGVEIDVEVVREFWDQPENCQIINKDVFDYIAEIRSKLHQSYLIYLDPPYLEYTRKSNRPLYRFEMMAEDEHKRLLSVIIDLPCKVMISGYQSDLYDQTLGNWRKASFHTHNRQNDQTLEVVWMNFPEPPRLHEYTFLGNDFRERERIKRMRKTLRKRLLKMEKYEREAYFATFEKVKNELASRNSAM